jgi:hypothetical protein
MAQSKTTTDKNAAARKRAEMDWWRLTGPRALEALKRWNEDIEREDDARLNAWARDVEMYGTQLAPSSRRRSRLAWAEDETLAANRLRRVVDTLHAKMVRNRVLGQCVSTGGDYQQRTRAKGQSLFLEGALAGAKFDRTVRLCGRDMFTCGAAFCKVTDVGEEGNASITIERVKPWTVRLRESESNGAIPPRLAIVDVFDADYLIEEFPDFESQILAASAPTPGAKTRLYDNYNPNGRRVIEAWSAPIGQSPGRHIIAIDTQILLEEEWQDPIPLADLRPYTPNVGYWPLSLVRQLTPIQREYEFNLAKMQASFRLASNVHFIVPPGVKIPTESMTTEPGTIWRAKPGDVQPFLPPSIAADLYRYVQDLGPLMQEISGASMMSVTNQKPGGVTAGIALQTLDDVESEGLMELHREWQDWHVRICELALAAARRVTEYDPKFAVRVLGKGRGQTVRFEDVRLDPDDYIIRVMPISQFARDFGARIDQAEKLLDRGALTIPQFREILDLPDLQAETDLDLSAMHVIDRNIDAILREQRPIVAEPFDDLATIIERGAKAYNLARLEGASEISLQLLREYIVGAQRLMAPPEPPPAPMPAPGGTSPAEMLPPDLAQLAGPAPALA